MIGRRIVVGRGDDGRNAPRLAAGQLEAFEGLRAGHFVHEVTVNVEERRAICFLMDDVVLPKLVVKGLFLPTQPQTNPKPISAKSALSVKVQPPPRHPRCNH
jgi:hypothetical protein